MASGSAVATGVWPAALPSPLVFDQSERGRRERGRRFRALPSPAPERRRTAETPERRGRLPEGRAACPENRRHPERCRSSWSRRDPPAGPRGRPGSPRCAPRQPHPAQYFRPLRRFRVPGPPPPAVERSPSPRSPKSPKRALCAHFRSAVVSTACCAACRSRALSPRNRGDDGERSSPPALGAEPRARLALGPIEPSPNRALSEKITRNGHFSKRPGRARFQRSLAPVSMGALSVTYGTAAGPAGGPSVWPCVFWPPGKDIQSQT